MHASELHPDLQKIYGRIPSVPFHSPAFYFFVDLIQRFAPRKTRQAPGVSIGDEKVRNCKVRIYRPTDSQPEATLLWIHGGGFIMGDVSMTDRECSAVAREMGIVVVSVNYRLAPRHPFPAALDDCIDAWKFAVRLSGELGIGNDHIAVLGQSAGGGLAASLVQRMHDEGGIQPAAQILMYPMLDDRTALDEDLDRLKHRLWNNKNNRAGWTWYLGQPAGQSVTPSYSVPARREDLRGLARAWLGVGELDLFYNEVREYAKRLEADGVQCDLYVAPRCPHAYDLMAADAPVSRRLIQEYRRFLKTALGLS